MGLGRGEEFRVEQRAEFGGGGAALRDTYNSVKSKARREDWAVNPVFGKVYPTAKERLPQTIKATKKAVADLLAENGAASRVHLSQAIRKGAEHFGELDGERVVEKHHALSSLAKSAATVHGWNDPDHSETNNLIVNLALLATPPEKLLIKPVRDVEMSVESGESPVEPLREDHTPNSDASQEQQASEHEIRWISPQPENWK